MKPQITFGVSLEEMVVGTKSISTVLHWLLCCYLLLQFKVAVQRSKVVIFIIYLFILKQVKALLKLYANEQYILFVNQQHGDFEVFVSFKVST